MDAADRDRRNPRFGGDTAASPSNASARRARPVSVDAFLLAALFVPIHCPRQPLHSLMLFGGVLLAFAFIMPIRYLLDDTHHRLNTRASGLLTLHDIDAHLDVEQRNRDLGVPELIDARGATTDLTAVQVQYLVDRATAMLRTIALGATAIVTDDPVVFEMARAYAARAERSGVVAEVFYDIDVASRWLDQVSPAG
jgi:hypothetical protein